MIKGKNAVEEERRNQADTVLFKLSLKSFLLHASIEKSVVTTVRLQVTEGPEHNESMPAALFAFSESLIRTAFQCLQLVVTDFLPTMPCTCLQIVVDVAGSFGLQNQELNISLTSIGLLVR